MTRGKELTQKNVEDGINGLGLGYILDDIYVKADNWMRVICPKHGAFQGRWSAMKLGAKCPKCARENRFLKHDEVKRMIADIGYELIDQYIDNSTKMKMVCPIHGIIEMKWGTLQSGSICKHCARDASKISKTDVDATIRKAGYTWISGEYERAHSKLILFCPIDGHGQFESTYAAIHYAGNECPKCAERKRVLSRRYNIEDVKRFIERTEDVLVGWRYKDDRGTLRVALTCSNCGKDYELPFTEYKQDGRRHGCRKRSIGEEVVEKFLIHNKIEYVREKTFPSCKNKNKLPFDFYLTNRNIIIEYNGKFHYEPFAFFGGEKRFESRKKNDDIKRQWCIKNDIELIDIPYWDFKNIEKILKKELKL